MSVGEWVWLSALCGNCQALTQSGIASSGVGVAGNEAISVLVGQGLEPKSSWLSLQCSEQKENHIFTLV